MARRQIHTTFNKSANNWRNISAGASKPAKTYVTKAEARIAGREQAIRQGSEHFIHNQNGQFAQRNSYGNDPRNRKG